MRREANLADIEELVQLIEQEFGSDLRDAEGDLPMDAEPVSVGLDGEGQVVASRLHFGHIRRARTALEALKLDAH